MNLLSKAGLAAVSGALCYAVYEFGFDGFWPEWVFYPVSGAIFAAGVLFPYLKFDKTVWFRGLGLIAMSALSYWCAIETANRTSSAQYSITTEAFVTASLVGAVIALTAARFIIPLRRSMTLVVAGIPAALLGGLPFGLLEGQSNLIWGLCSFASWHSLMAVAIHVSENFQARTVFRG